MLENAQTTCMYVCPSGLFKIKVDFIFVFSSIFLVDVPILIIIHNFLFLYKHMWFDK